MTTPWPSPAARAPAADGFAGAARASYGAGPVDAEPPLPSSAAGYADGAGRAAAEREARAVLAAAARGARDRLGDLQRRCVDAGRMAEAGRMEAVLGRLGRVLDRLSSPAAIGPWWRATALPPDAAAWLADCDRRLALALGELAATASAGDATAAVAETCDSIVAEAAALLDGRRDGLAAREWAPRPLPTGLGAVVPGERIASDGHKPRAIEVARFVRGDVGVALDDGIVLWEDVDGRRVAFEAASVDVPAWPPPPVLDLADDTFRTAWSDDGAAVVRSLTGRRSVAGPRSLLAGDAGGWLWLGRSGDDVAAWRGAGVDAGEGARAVPP